MRVISRAAWRASTKQPAPTAARIPAPSAAASAAAARKTGLPVMSAMIRHHTSLCAPPPMAMYLPHGLDRALFPPPACRAAIRTRHFQDRLEGVREGMRTAPTDDDPARRRIQIRAEDAVPVRDSPRGPRCRAPPRLRPRS